MWVILKKVTFLDCKKSHLLVGAHNKSPTIAVFMSIPPRAGGILITGVHSDLVVPITPACGGNTLIHCRKQESGTDSRDDYYEIEKMLR